MQWSLYLRAQPPKEELQGICEHNRQRGVSRITDRRRTNSTIQSRWKSGRPRRRRDYYRNPRTNGIFVLADGTVEASPLASATQLA